MTETLVSFAATAPHRKLNIYADQQLEDPLACVLAKISTLEKVELILKVFKVFSPQFPLQNELQVVLSQTKLLQEILNRLPASADPAAGRLGRDSANSAQTRNAYLAALRAISSKTCSAAAEDPEAASSSSSSSNVKAAPQPSAASLSKSFWGKQGLANEAGEVELNKDRSKTEKGEPPLHLTILLFKNSEMEFQQQKQQQQQQQSLSCSKTSEVLLLRFGFLPQLA
ncbi:hypothetical protein, conserved, partial [Eimeria tenella]